jgi:hypothetical protein
MHNFQTIVQKTMSFRPITALGCFAYYHYPDMKILFPAICLALFAGFSARVSAALIAYEGYSYPPDTDLSTGANGGSGWAGEWVNADYVGTAVAVGVQTAVAGSLNYVDASGKRLATSGNKALYSGSNESNCQPGRPLSKRRGDDGTSTWLSFLMVRLGDKSGTQGVDSSPSYQRGANFTLWDTTDTTAATAQRLGIGESSGALAGNPDLDTWSMAPRGSGALRRLSTNSVHAVDKIALLVARIDHHGDQTAADDVYLWVNPALGVAPLTNNAVISILSDTNVYDYSFDWVRHFAGNPNTGSGQPAADYHFDELRIGETFADVTPVASPLIAYESFDYAAGSDLTGKNGGTGWTSPWGANSGGTTDPAGAVSGDTAVAGSLNYTDSKGNTLVTSGGHGNYSGTAGTSQPFRDIEMRGEPGSTTWISFVGKRGGETVADPANPYPRGANLAFFEGGTERFAFGNASGSPTNAWSILNGGGAVANLRPSTRPFEQLTFLVVRVDHKDGLDNTYLFINPDLSVEPNISAAAATTLEEFEHAFNRVRPFAGNLDTGNSRPFAEISLDEIRIGTTYQAVTPFTPGGAGQPLKVSISRSANQVELTWTEGTLESAASITGPWSAVQGATVPSYRLTADGTQRYFRLRK